MNNDIKSNLLVFAGPFLGEFGWELSHWMPHVRWLKQKHYNANHLIVASYPEREALYYGIADEFYSLPDWFIEKKYDCDCFEALCPYEDYARLLDHFRNLYKDKFSQIIETRTPRGFNKVIRETNQVLFEKLEPSKKADEICQDMLKAYSDKPSIIIFAREVYRKAFLDIKLNRPVQCDLLSHPLPSRNWPKSHWEKLFDMLYAKYKDQVTFVIGGTKGGNCLIDKGQLDDVINLCGINNLDLTIAYLNHAMLSISSQGGSTHLALQCGCPSFIYGHEECRHAIDDNPLKTEVTFFATDINHYADHPQALYQDICVTIDDLMERRVKNSIQGRDTFITNASPTEAEIRNKPPLDMSKLMGNKKIKKIGMVGVFDKEGSTNIPFANAFESLGYEVERLNYRTIVTEYSLEEMNLGIEFMSSYVDLMVFCKCNAVAVDTFKHCAENTQTCFYMMDAIIHLQNIDFFEYAKICDFSVVTTKSMKDALDDADVGKSVHHIIQGIDSKEFYPVEAEKKYDIVFIGTKSEKRDRILTKIINWGYSVKVYGNGYSEIVRGEDFNRACCEGRICIAINNTDAGIDSFSDRMLRYMATKSCVLTEYSKGLENYFENNEHLVWFKETDDVRQIIHDLLQVDLRRKRIAQSGYEKVIEQYTWDNVAKEIMEIALNLNKGEAENVR